MPWITLCSLNFSNAHFAFVNYDPCYILYPNVKSVLMLDGKLNHLTPTWLMHKWHQVKRPKCPSSNPSSKPPSPNSSTIFDHTPCRTAHEIHNQKPTHHHTATNFRAWDPMPKIKSQTQIHRNWIQNHKHKFRPTHKRSTNTNPQFLINTFRSQTQISTNLSPRSAMKVREREIERRDESYKQALIMDATFSSWSWPYQFWITTKKHQIVSERERLKPRICDTYFEFWLGRGAFRSFDKGHSLWCKMCIWKV